MIGIVKTLVKEKAFGFIRGEDGKDYFFHKSETDPFIWDLIVMSGNNGSQSVKLTFDTLKSDRGLRASNVGLYKDDN